MCGVCGVYLLNSDNLLNIARALDSVGLNGQRIVEKDASAAGVLYFLLRELNNRGHDSTGIVTFDGIGYRSHREMGFAEKVFNQGNLETLVGRVGIGNDRYATTGLPKRENIQPFFLNVENLTDNTMVGLALSHNGNITNQQDLRARITEEEQKIWGESLLASTTDSELILHRLGLELYRNPKTQLEVTVSKTFNEIRGAYSIMVIVNGNLVGIRDPYGFWPLITAKLGNLVIFSSEEEPIKRFIDASGYSLKSSDFVREVKRGDIEIVSENAFKTYTGLFPARKESNCSFDFSYLRSHEDSRIRNFRRFCGIKLWEKFPVEADFISPVPNSGIYYAKGISEASGIEYRELISISDKYRTKSGRTFQKPTLEARLDATKEKYEFESSYEGLRLVISDDSIVRSTTQAYIIRELRQRRVAEIHLRIGTPLIVTPCYLGIHTPTKEELIGSSLSEEQLGKYFECIFYGVDYNKDKLMSFIKNGNSVGEIIERSVKDGENYLPEQLRKFIPGKFSLKYMPTEEYKRSFDLAGLNSETKCYACQITGGKGYPLEIKEDLIKLTVV